MSRNPECPPRLLVPALLWLLASQPLAGATYVMVSDQQLVDGAELVVQGAVSARAASRQDYRTRYHVTVERVLVGSVASETVEVTVPGGQGPKGLALHVPGSPSLEPGERVLLFLHRGNDGSYRVAHLGLGAFHQAEADGRLLWVRHLEESRQVSLDEPGMAAIREAEEQPRDAVLFETWLHDRGRGVARDQDYHVDVSWEGVQNVAPRWTHLAGKRLRWFDFDTGGAVSWRSVGSIQGHAGSLADGGVGELERAIAAWVEDPASEVSFHYAGTATDWGDLCSMPDGEGRVLFEDPNGYFDPASFDPSICAGLVAVGGVCYTEQEMAFKGRAFRPAVRGFIVTQRHIGCLFQGSHGSQIAEQLLGHEIGHALGLGHSCGDALSPGCHAGSVLDQALMRSALHLDDRGAALNCDDRMGLRYLYGELAEEGDPPGAPSSLEAVAVSSHRIDLSWAPGPGNEDGFVVEMSRGGPFQYLATLEPGSSNASVSDLEPAATYTFRVQAFKCSTESPYSNPASATTPSEGGGGRPPPPLEGCTTDPQRLCLGAGRFSVEVEWKDFGGRAGSGRAVPLTSDTGYFWFFHPDNVELTVKVLDGRAINGKHWVFYGALSNVEYTITVTDTATGAVKAYHNPAGSLASSADVAAFTD
jgi:hypothetical protein